MYKNKIQELMGSLGEASEMIMMQQLQLETLRNEYMQVGSQNNYAEMRQGGYPGDLQQEHIAQLQSEIENFQMLNQEQQNQFIQQMEVVHQQQAMGMHD